jgi:PKD repeat protein
MQCSFPDIDTVYLDGSDSFDTDGTIIYYHWDFGDGNTESGVTAAHTYSESGIYRVTLTITDNGGLQNSCEKNVNISSKKPNPIMQYTFSENDGATVNFDGSDSFDIDGTIVSYSWDFGDGNTGRGSTINHTYDTQGLYRVTLTVTDNDELENLCEKNLNIKSGDDEEPGKEPGPGESKKSENDNSPGQSKKPEESKKPEDNEGAGKKDMVPAENAVAATGSIKPGENTGNAIGDTKSGENTVAAIVFPELKENKKPHAKIEYSFSKTNANKVYVNGSDSFDTDGTIIYYHWDFGDGNTETRASSTHTYGKPGQYSITLTVTDNEGLMNCTSRTVNIKSNKINNTDNNYNESIPHNNREEHIKNMGVNLNEFKDIKISPPEEPDDLTLKANNILKKLLNVKQDKNVDIPGININSIGELLDIQKITENHNLKEVIDLDELIDINYERDTGKYRDNIPDKKLKLPEFLLNFWNKFKELVTL